MKNPFKIAFLFLGMLLLTFSCQKEESVENTNAIITQTKTKTQFNEGQQVSKNIIAYLKNQTNNTFAVDFKNNGIQFSKVTNPTNTLARMATPLGVINTYRELVIENETNKAHTFTVQSVNEPINTLTNLTVKETENGYDTYFMRYNFESNTNSTAFQNPESPSQFTANVETFNSQGQLIGQMQITNGIVTQAIGNNMNCGTALQENNTNNTSSTSGGSGIPNNTNSNTNNNDSNGLDGTDGGSGGISSVMNCEVKHVTESSLDLEDIDPSTLGNSCCIQYVIECETTQAQELLNVGLIENYSPDPCEVLPTGILFNMEDTQCINEIDTSGLSFMQTLEINSFIQQNGCSEENIEFALLAIEAIINAGEMDYENQIIKDSSFIGTIADCVLDELISTGNNIFRTISEAFTNNNSEYKIRFTVEQSSQNAPAHTPLPDENNIINIEIDPDYVNGNAIDLAAIILHETIHAELHRIYLTNNQQPNPLPQDLFNWYIDMWERYEGLTNSSQSAIATAAEHYYMAAYYINNIAQGLRQFDENAQSLEHYKGFAWEGLSDYGIEAGYITSDEFGNFLDLSHNVYIDNHTNNCDD